MGDGRSADDGPVIHVGLAGQGNLGYQDGVVPDVAVVGDMDVRHHEDIIADFGEGLAGGGCSPVDGHAFTDIDPVADFDPGLLPVELEVLGNGADHGTRKDRAVFPHSDIRENDGIRKNLAAVADFDVFVDVCERSDLDVVAEFGFRTHACERMDFVHIE